MGLFNVYPLYDVTPVSAKGIYVYDEDNREYLDLYGGHAVISIGHGHPKYVKAITKQVAKYDTLTTINKGLSEKVVIGSVLKVNSAKILAMRERSGGKLVETSRSRNADAFRVNFTIAKNEISEQGERQVYIQIVDLKGNTIAKKGSFMMFDNTEANYSDKTTVNYLNEPIDIISLIEVNRDISENDLMKLIMKNENLKKYKDESNSSRSRSSWSKLCRVYCN